MMIFFGKSPLKCCKPLGGLKKSSLTFFNQDGGEVRTFGNEKDKEGKHLGDERIKPMSTWPSLSFPLSLVVGG